MRIKFFGDLTSAPGKFILSALSHENILLFLDDVIIFPRKFEEHLESLAAILRRLKKGDLKNKRSKRRILPKKIFSGRLCQTMASK